MSREVNVWGSGWWSYVSLPGWWESLEVVLIKDIGAGTSIDQDSPDLTLMYEDVGVHGSSDEKLMLRVSPGKLSVPLTDSRHLNLF